MAEDRQPGMVIQFLKTFFGSIGLLFVPLPFSIFRRQLAGKVNAETGEMEFYSHPNFICTMHLIWIGWIVTLCALFNDVSESKKWNVEISPTLLGWIWLFVLLLTLIVMGLRFGRVQVGFLVAAIALVGMGLGLIQAFSDIAVFSNIYSTLKSIDTGIDWGVPFVVSMSVGLLFVCVVTWRRMNDRWSLKERGNYLEHENFQQKDRSISKGAKTFVAVFPCLLKRYLLFGFGDIEVRSSTGTKLIDSIEGVMFAKHHSDIIKRRFGTTDIQAMAAAEEQDEEEQGDIEDVVSDDVL